MIKFEFESLDYVQFDRRAVRSAMGKAARIVAKHLKASMGKGGGGRKRGRGSVHSGSAPGQPPARFTGTLFRSVKGRSSRRGYALVIEAIAPHARLVELGTRRMAPRPAFAPAFTAQRGAIQDLLRAAVGEGLTVIAGKPDQPPKDVEVN